MQEKEKRPFSRLMSISLVLNITNRPTIEADKAEGFEKYLDMLNISEFSFLEIDASFFYYALTNH